MRIVVDLQGAQTESRFRGIGRYSLALTLALARNAKHHDIWLVLNDAFPDSIVEIREAFADLIPPEKIQIFGTPSAGVAEKYIQNKARARGAEKIREYLIHSLKPDMVLVTSLFEGYFDNAVTSVSSNLKERTAVILYDLIPLLMDSALYLPTALSKQHYQSKVQALKNAGLLLSISEYSRQSAIESLNCSPEKVVNISTAVDSFFKPTLLSDRKSKIFCTKHHFTRNILLYVPSGTDPRKNVNRLIEAYRLLPADLRAAYQLVLPTGRAGDIVRTEIKGLCKHLELAEDEIILTGFLSNDDLIKLYNLATLCVYPSLLEGFGLPVLEAMSCGVPVIGSNTSSIPEIIGREDALFDPYSAQSIADKIEQVLRDDHFRSELGDYSLKQAKKFSWDLSAKRAISALEEHEAKLPALKGEGHTNEKNLKLAFVSPLPSETTKMSYYVKLLTELLKYFEVDWIIEKGLNESSDAPPFSIRSAKWFEENVHTYDRILYIFENTQSHSYLLSLLEHYSGAIVLQDFFMGHLWKDQWLNALFHSHGYQAVCSQQRATSEEEINHLKEIYPCNLQALQWAKGVIVSSETIKTLALQWYESKITEKWTVIPQDHPETDALQYKREVEAIYQEKAHDQYEWMKAISRLNQKTPIVEELKNLASAASITFKPAPRLKQLFVDVTLIAREDMKTGIQRVVRAQLSELIKNPPTGFRVEPVSLSYDGYSWFYHYARKYTFRMLGLSPHPAFEDAVLDIYPEDVLYMLDFVPQEVVYAAKSGFFTSLRAMGVQINTLVYDLLPIQMPEFFPIGSARAYRNWLIEVSKYADRLIGISFSVANEIRDWLEKKKRVVRSRPLKITAAPLGADIKSSIPTSGFPVGSAVLEEMKKRLSFLMVGTIEPRKGHLQTLEAFEQLWQEGHDVLLVIVGKEGWKNLPDSLRGTIPDVVNKCRTHPELEKRLFWLENVSDAYLEAIYEVATCFLSASEGEGFGLPIIEACHHQLPVIVRDLPVFREITQSNAYYFSGLSAQELAMAIKNWLKLYKAREIVSSDIQWNTWEESVALLKAILQGNVSETLWPEKKEAF